MTAEAIAAPAHGRWRRLRDLGLAVLVFQLAYWLALAPLFRSAPLPAESRIHAGEVARLAEPTWAAVETARFQPVKLPWYADRGCCYVFRHTFDAPPGGGDMAVILNLGADNEHVRVNGQLLWDRGALWPVADKVSLTRLIRIPRALLKPAGNRLEALTVRQSTPYTDVYPFNLGDYRTIEEAGRWRLFVLHGFQHASAFVAGLIALLALIVLPMARNRVFAASLAALAGFWALRTGYYFWDGGPVPPVWRAILYFVFTNGLTLAWLAFIDAWTGASWRWLRWGTVGAFVAVCGVIAIAMLNDLLSGYELAGGVTDALSLGAGLAALARFGWHIARRPEPRIWEAAAFLLCLTALAADALSEIVWNRVATNTIQVVPFLLFALVAAIVTRNLRLYESMAAFNEALNRRLAEREMEIRDRYAELRAAQKARDLAEERQRLVRDMHDGVGGQLLGLILRVRKPGADLAEIETALEASATDLRLVVESLDTVGDSLHTALGAFRGRLAPQAEAAGVELVWDNRLEEDLAGYGPREVLQVYRILQEAVANALRHAGAKTLRVTVAPGPGPNFPVEVTVADDGKGLPEERSAGKGLESMRRRAAQLGARLTVESAAGVTVRLALPARAEAEASP